MASAASGAKSHSLTLCTSHNHFPRSTGFPSVLPTGHGVVPEVVDFIIEALDPGLLGTNAHTNLTRAHPRLLHLRADDAGPLVLLVASHADNLEGVPEGYSAQRAVGL